MKEEIASESLVRNLPAFADFLKQAAISDGEVVSFENIARECSVSAKSVKEYFNILEDTLIGYFVPSYTRNAIRRTLKMPKFYFRDCGTTNFLAGRRNLKPGDDFFGKAFENWLAHEIKAYSAYSEKYFDRSYWRLSSGIEVDFILGEMEIAIECRASERIRPDHFKGLIQLKNDFPNVRERILVCLDSKDRKLDDGIWVLNIHSFLKNFWAGNWI